MLTFVKQKIVNWLLKDVEIDELIARRIKTTGNTLYSDVISERTAGAGVTIDGALLKDGLIDLAAIPTPLTGKDADSVDGYHATQVKKAILDSDEFYWHTLFESLDGINQYTSNTGSISLDNTNGYINLTTGTTSGSRARISKVIGLPVRTFSWSKDRYFRCAIEYTSATSPRYHTIDIGTGQVAEDYLTPEQNGFKFFFYQDDDLQAASGDGTNYQVTTLLTATSPNTKYLLEAYFDASAGEIYFYVDGTLYATHTTVPTGTGYANNLMTVGIWNNAAADKGLHISEFEIWQEG